MKNKNLWVELFGVALGIALSANAPVIPEQFYAMQRQIISGNG